MLKDIQKQLLLKYPLLWNTKFVPMVVIGLAIHLIFFALGYLDGTIDFSGKIAFDLDVFSVMFGILLCLIIIILWLVNYFKNNALKSFYSKSKEAVFYEWLQIFVICTLLITFYIPFSVGKQWHQSSYYSLEETKRRCAVISSADMFIDGSFAETEIDSVASGLKTEIIDKVADSTPVNGFNEDYEYNGRVFKNHIVFDGKVYNRFSLLNRNNFHFSISTPKEDSIQKIKVQNWLHTNNQRAIKNLMSDYLTILREHRLKTNLTLEKWFEITYKNPDFENFFYIKPYVDEYEATNRYDYRDQRFQPYTNYDTDKYSHYFVQQNVLKEKYDIIADAHTNAYFNYEVLVFYLYSALGLSLFIFSFRVTSGKSWLIALVAIGVLNIVYGIFSAASSSILTYLFFIFATIIGLSIYYLVIFTGKKTIQYSRIALNMLLWSFTYCIPIIYFFIIDSYRNKNYDYHYEESIYVRDPFYDWLNYHITDMFLINFFVTILVLFFLTKTIRNWKGLAEE